MSIEVTYKGSMGNDLTVVNAARVSFGKESEWEYEESDAYSFKQHLKTKDRKLIQISRRYVDSEPEFYMPRSWRGRSADKKQGSTGEWYDDDLDFVVKESHTACFNAYKELLENDVCPEQARMVLPQSMVTEWYWSGSLDAFADMCNLRCKPDTQAETAEVAWEIDRIMIDLFPVSWRALREND